MKFSWFRNNWGALIIAAISMAIGAAISASAH
jgi:hypothetical protein